MSNFQKRGWVRLHRKIEENELWLAEPFTRGQAWVDLFLNANHTDGVFWIRGNEIQVKRGQLGWSEVTMSNRWKWSRNKVRRFLLVLEKNAQIGQQKLSKLTSVITILNYEHYQSEQQTEQQKDNRRNTNNNDKNEKKLLAEANASATNRKDMEWKNKPSDNDDDLDVIDIETGEPAKPKEKKKRHYKEVYELFRVLGPVPLNWSVNTTEQKCADNLYTERGLEQIKTALQFYLDHKHLEYIPEITSPYDLDSKWKKLLSFKKKNG